MGSRKITMKIPVYSLAIKAESFNPEQAALIQMYEVQVYYQLILRR